MGTVTKEELIKAIQEKKFCKYCVYVGRNNKCFYPGENKCSPACLASSLIKYVVEEL